jgi:hypothetical protein
MAILTGIMGREAAYCGKTIEWDAALNSKQDLSPAVYEWGPLPIGETPMPGKYRFT